MKKTVKIGYIGLGRRGYGMLKRQFSQMDDVEIVMMSDLSEKRLEKARAFLSENTAHTPICTTDYREIIACPDIDAVVIMTGWSGRPAIAMEAMRAGKYAAIEVGCADNLEECYEVVRTYEETGMPLMMLENCCYGRREMMALNLVKQGLFGELVHCTGGYHHYLNEVELFKDIDAEDIPHYRLAHYRDKNRENYPTHEFGPISKVLSINRGNRVTRLSSFASKAVGIKAYAAEHLGADSPYATADYRQGDIVNTILTTENGETVLLTLDTTVPRAYYSRNFSVRGTKGMYEEVTDSVFIDTEENRKKDFTWRRECVGNAADFAEEYDHPTWKDYLASGVQGTHDGMDYLEFKLFIGQGIQ
jgi:predicted dehydrogenase